MCWYQPEIIVSHNLMVFQENYKNLSHDNLVNSLDICNRWQDLWLTPRTSFCCEWYWKEILEICQKCQFVFVCVAQFILFCLYVFYLLCLSVCHVFYLLCLSACHGFFVCVSVCHMCACVSVCHMCVCECVGVFRSTWLSRSAWLLKSVCLSFILCLSESP